MYVLVQARIRTRPKHCENMSRWEMHVVDYIVVHPSNQCCHGNATLPFISVAGATTLLTIKETKQGAIKQLT